jgi:hypothetical protein
MGDLHKRLNNLASELAATALFNADEWPELNYIKIGDGQSTLKICEDAEQGARRKRPDFAG